jgi:Do/DeqQ family serine protease
VNGRILAFFTKEKKGGDEMKRLNLLWIVLLFQFACRNKQTGEQTKSAPNNNITTFEEKQKQARQISKADSAITLDAQKVETVFRYAAKNVTAGVVHLEVSYPPSGNQRPREFDPFRNFFNFMPPSQQNMPKEIGSASGVIVSADGYIVTSNHVVDGANEVQAVLNDQRSYKAKVIGTDPSTDLALLKINEKDLTFIPFGNSDDAQIGDWVLAVGNPFDLSSTITAGIISAKARSINILPAKGSIESFIQTDAAINPGNSGGALVDLNGKLIGITAAIATPTGAYAGYSFAVPVDIVKKVIDDLLNYGKVERGYLGVTIRQVTSDEAKKIGRHTGVWVDSVVAGSAAKNAGIKKEDLITAINGHPVTSPAQLTEIISLYKPGDKIQVSLFRNGEERQVDVTLKSLTKEMEKSATQEKKQILDILGIQVEELSSSEKNDYNVKGGLKVTEISEGKIARFTNMQRGFIITAVNGTLVSTKDDLVKALTNKKGGIMLSGFYPDAPGTTYYYAFGM